MIRFAFRNLLTRPVRSLLALVGLVVAIAGMVGLYSVAGGIDDMVRSTFGEIPGLVVMQPGAPIPLFSRLPASWAGEIRKINGVRVVHPEVWTRAHVINGSPTISPPRFLFGIEIAETLKLRRGVYRDALTKGRFLEMSDRGTANIVISESIAEEFEKKVGDTLRVDNETMTIVGIYQTGSLLLDVAILCDAPRVREQGRMGLETSCAFYVEPETVEVRDRVKKDIQELFRGRTPEAWEPASALDAEITSTATNPLARLLVQFARWISGPSWKIKPKPALDATTAAESATAGREIPVEIRSSDDWAAQFQKFSADLDIFLTIMTSIGVVIAVLGIVNTMLMSVTERFIEFGILKANGWSSRDVLLLIGWESALLGVAGGSIGSVCGWIATLIINANWPHRIHLYASPQLLVFSLLFSTVVGLLGGLYPALWASRMMPMDAIRRG
jgi:putative ABC transport system permease protein